GIGCMKPGGFIHPGSNDHLKQRVGKFENISDPFSYPFNGNETPNFMGVPLTFYMKWRWKICTTDLKKKSVPPPWKFGSIRLIFLTPISAF
ncbi:MAG: hypothetical protein WA151_09580, partial [Desulfatirhabdiaceae bacterium]